MENTYYINNNGDGNEETDIQALYDKLFRNFHFSTSLKDANVLVIPGSSYKEKEVRKAMIYLVKPEENVCEMFSDDKGHSVYVIYSNNLFVSEELVVFLNKKGLYSKDNGEFEVVPPITDLLKVKDESFLLRLLRGTFEIVENEEECSFVEYLSYLLKEICPALDVNACLSEYIKEFYVAFTTRDFASDNACNMETREFIGDRVAWSSMTSYFINRCKQEGSILTQNQMTHLHQDYCSKEIQSSISYSLFMFKFIRTNTRITINTHEDLFESFVGTLYEISFRERGKGLQMEPLNLHNLFLEKIYDSFEITTVSGNSTKPSITEFSEMMVSLTATNVSVNKVEGTRSRALYSIRKTKNSISISFPPFIKDVLLSNLNGSESEEQVGALINLLRTKKQFNEMNEGRECDLYFKLLIKGIRDIVGDEMLSDLQNLKSLSQEQLDTLKITLGTSRFACHLRNVERNWSDTFWELTLLKAMTEDEETFSTELLPNPDMFETLLSLVKGDTLEDIDVPMENILIESKGTSSDYILFTDTNVKKYINEKATTYQVRKFLVSNPNTKLYTSVFGKDIDCSCDNTVSFKPQFHRFTSTIEHWINIEDYVKHIASLLGYDETSIQPSSTLNAFVGNRMLMTYVNRIFYSLMRNASEFELDSFQKYYTSKVIKKEIASLMKCPPLLSLDELLGRLDDTACQGLINLIYLNLIIKNEDCFNYAKEVNSICNALTPVIPVVSKDKQVKPVFLRPLSFFKTIGNTYVFKFKEITSSISFKHKSYSYIRVVFEKEVYHHLLQVFGVMQVSNLLNKRYLNNPTYNKLALLLKRNFHISTIELKGKKRIQLRIGVSDTIIIDTLEEAYIKLSENGWICT